MSQTATNEDQFEYDLTPWQYPDDIELGGMLNAPMMDQDLMKIAIRRAAAIIHHEEATPSFTRLANVVLNSDDDTVTFTKRCTTHMEHRRRDDCGLEMVFDMSTFAFSTTIILISGWEDYIQQLKDRPIDEKYGKVAFSVI